MLWFILGIVWGYLLFGKPKVIVEKERMRITVKKEVVIKRAKACMRSIKQSRMDSDTRQLVAEYNKLCKRNDFWHKWTFGLIAKKDGEELDNKADANLRGGMWYPDKITSGRWLDKAQRLLDSTKHCSSDEMCLDDNDMVVLNWVKDE